MANIKISDLTAAAAATGTQEFEVNDSLTSKKVTGAQILAYVEGEVSSSPSFTGQVSIDDGSASAPSLTNTGDSNTGLYFPAADTVAISTGGTKRLEVNSSGTTTLTGNQVISVTDNTNAALRITQLGTGNALVVEDSTNPDSTPFVVDASGNVGIGTASPSTKLHVLTPSATTTEIRVGNSQSYNAFLIDGSGNAQIYTPANNQIFTVNSAERMRIDANGNVGIGTASPGAKLTLGGGTTDQYINREVNTGALILTGGQGIVSGNSSAGLVLRGSGSSYNAAGVELYTNGAERIRVDSNGYVGIGTVDPASWAGKLAIIGSIASGGWNYVAAFSDAINSTFRIGQASGKTGLITDTALVFSTAGAERMSINTSGNVTIPGRIGSVGTYNNTSGAANVNVASDGTFSRSSSSMKYKKDVEALDQTLVDNAVANLRPVWFRTKNPGGDDKPNWSHIGLIAEEVSQIEPRLVEYKTMDVSQDENGEQIVEYLDNPEPEGVKYSLLSVLLLDKVKRQDAAIAALEARIAALEAA